MSNLPQRGPFDTPGTPPPAPPVPVPVPTPVLPQVDLSTFTEYSGVWFDRATGKTYREDGVETGFTFEAARWSGPWGSTMWPWLNPIGFATHETALKVRNFAWAALPPGYIVEIDERQNITGPFARTVERRLLVSRESRNADFIRHEEFSAGWLANSIIRRGEKRAAYLFAAEVADAATRGY